jgi:hypothetical protein
MFIQSRDRGIKRQRSTGGHSIQQRLLKMLWKSRKCYNKILFSLNSSVMDDNYDTFKTANNEIIQLFFERLINCLTFFNLILLVKYISLSALHRISSPISIFEPVKSFIHVSVRTDDKMYNCKTATISLIFF